MDAQIERRWQTLSAMGASRRCVLAVVLKEEFVSEIDLYARSDLWRRLPEGVCARFFQQFIELLREQSPLEWFETAEAAILAHDKNFADLDGGSLG